MAHRLPDVVLMGWSTWNTPNMLIDDPRGALKLIEYAGRKAYGSPQSPDMAGTVRWIRARMDGWEHDVVEHAQTHWEFDFSRVVAQEATRHRIAAYTMQSMRFKAPTLEDMELVPPEVKESDREEWVADYKATFALYEKWLERGYKRQTARYHLPIGSATSLFATWNFRELRHIFGLRATRKAQPEFHYLADKMFKQAVSMWPAVFEGVPTEAWVDPNLPIPEVLEFDETEPTSHNGGLTNAG